DDAARTRQQAMQAQLSAALASERVRVFFADGSKVELQPAPGGLAALPLASWLLCAAALALYLLAAIVMLKRPTGPNLVLAAVAGGAVPQAWWWTQAAVLLMGLMAIGLLSWSYQIEPHPFAIVLRQFGVVSAGTWALMTLALAASDGLRNVPHNIADIAAVVWYVYLAAVLLLVPFLAKSQSILREFALLAAVSTVAISLYLLFISVFSLGQPAALTLSL